MTQIFSSTADTWLRLFVAGGIVMLSGSVAGVIAFARSDYYTGAKIHPPPQPVTMEFCIDCHRDPAPELRPPERITDLSWKPDDVRALGEKLIRRNGIRLGEITYCYVCHR